MECKLNVSVFVRNDFGETLCHIELQLGGSINAKFVLECGWPWLLDLKFYLASEISLFTIIVFQPPRNENHQLNEPLFG